MEQNNRKLFILVGMLIAVSFFGVGFFSRPFIIKTEKNDSLRTRPNENSPALVASSSSSAPNTSSSSVASSTSQEIKAIPPAPKTFPSPFVRIVAPRGGETLCMGQKFTIRWEHRGAINVYISFGRPGGSYYYLPLLPADLNEQGENGYGEYEWIIGKTNGGHLPEGTTYKIKIQAATSGSNPYGDNIEDESDDIFSVIQCEG